eukprot:CAMPEP_0115307462 /NCGR_PEP_ID=MMETSP0270-20121206/73153_1 /TAXON_ID=71861 /ORGANISM="Scrippsiella trochoidea, Strain CCMP3099" /LENGTH=44 /DNA_ID= /DNA_START= /DNA_END= /DNA_ORIENTATION=
MGPRSRKVRASAAGRDDIDVAMENELETTVVSKKPTLAAGGVEP